jgi:catechol 2,3-dioxygenase-like lactoylglutathione lyase family enzyme
MDVLFVAGFAPIVRDPLAARALYRDTLGLPLETVSGDYLAVDGWGDVRHLGVWPLTDAAQACFGTDAWPDHLPVPQATLELEVADVAAAAAELRAAGHELLHDVRTEPWGQVIARREGEPAWQHARDSAESPRIVVSATALASSAARISM